MLSSVLLVAGMPKKVTCSIANSCGEPIPLEPLVAKKGSAPARRRHSAAAVSPSIITISRFRAGMLDVKDLAAHMCSGSVLTQALFGAYELLFYAPV